MLRGAESREEGAGSISVVDPTTPELSLAASARTLLWLQGAIRFPLGRCPGFLGLPQQRTTSRVTSNSRNLFPHGSGGQKFQIKIGQGRSPSSGSHLFQLLVAPGIPWLVAA